MSTPTLSRLADIGAEAALGYLANHQDDSNIVSVARRHHAYIKDAPAREAFVKAVLDTVGYEFPVDPEREAFDGWVKERGWESAVFLDDAYVVWKAGRDKLRGELEIRDARSEQEHAAEIAQPAPSSTERLGAFYKQVYEQFKIEVQKAVQESKSATAAKPAPETFEAHGLTWFKHTPGDPMPCDGTSAINCLFGGRSSNDDPTELHTAGERHWGVENRRCYPIVAWRYADAP